MILPAFADTRASTPGSKVNSFTFLRLSFALAVLFFHSSALGGFPEGPRLAMVPLLGFFFLSGFLLTQSLTLHPNTVRYCVHRVARILPGLYVNLALVGFVLLPLLLMAQSGWERSYGDCLTGGSSSPLRYFLVNLGIRVEQWVVDGLFENHPFKLVNGSLWSLILEVYCYVVLLICWKVGLLKRRGLCLGLLIAVLALHLVQQGWQKEIQDSIQSYGTAILYVYNFSSFFLAFALGAAAYLWHPAIRLKWSFAIAAAVALGAAVVFGLIDFVWPIPLCYLILFAAYRLPFSNFERFGDFSYGVYIYGWPVQQTLVFIGLHKFGFIVYTSVTVILVLALAWLSWTYVEKPTLRWARGFVRGKSAESSAALQAGQQASVA